MHFPTLQRKDDLLQKMLYVIMSLTLVSDVGGGGTAYSFTICCAGIMTLLDHDVVLTKFLFVHRFMAISIVLDMAYLATFGPDVGRTVQTFASLALIVKAAFVYVGWRYEQEDLRGMGNANDLNKQLSVGGAGPLAPGPGPVTHVHGTTVGSMAAPAAMVAAGAYGIGIATGAFEFGDAGSYQSG